MEVARLVGLEIRDYEKDGQKRRYCGLHLVHVEDPSGDVIGSRVEVVSCPRGVDPNRLEIGHLYDLQYDLFNMKGQKLARLKGLDPVEG